MALSRAARASVIAVYALVFWGALPLALIRIARALDAGFGWTAEPTPAGWLLVVGGLALCVWGMISLRSLAHAWPVTALPPPRLAIGGPYRRMRHPIYVGFNVAIFGAGVAMGERALAVVVAPMFLPLWMLYASFEERVLARRFGDDYRRYREQVGLTPQLVLQDASAPIPRMRYASIFFLEYAIFGLVYYAINATTADRAGVGPLLPYEQQIPFTSAAYPVYALVYVQAWLPLLLAPSRRDYLRVQIAFGVASAIGFAVFLLYPMAYPRPQLDVGNLFDRMLAVEYATDRPVCTFPSLHVAISWILFFTLGTTRPWRGPLFLLALSTSVSTLLVKQHFVVDVLGGVLLAVVSVLVAKDGARIRGNRGEGGR